MSPLALIRSAGIGPRRRLRDGLLRVAEAAVTPLELGDVLDVFSPLAGRPPWPDPRGRPRDHHVRIARHQARAGLGRPRPGQYVRVGVDVDGVRLWRTYRSYGPDPTGASASP